jgi:quercetin dioxygenase-like cupin family protein
MFAVPPNTVAPGGTPVGAHPVLIARQFAEERARWAHLLRYDPDERFATLVERTLDQEVWLMGWLPGQSTDNHDHGWSSGAFTVVSGALVEVALTGPGAVAARRGLTQGQSRVFGPGYAHRVRNESADPAVSIHVYRGERPPLGGFTVG